MKKEMDTITVFFKVIEKIYDDPNVIRLPVSP